MKAALTRYSQVGASARHWMARINTGTIHAMMAGERRLLIYPPLNTGLGWPPGNASKRHCPIGKYGARYLCWRDLAVHAAKFIMPRLQGILHADGQRHIFADSPAQVDVEAEIIRNLLKSAGNSFIDRFQLVHIVERRVQLQPVGQVLV